MSERRCESCGQPVGPIWVAMTPPGQPLRCVLCLPERKAKA